jgi:acetylornithine/N-succinyldiaminopimelate aminotransferase
MRTHEIDRNYVGRNSAAEEIEVTGSEGSYFFAEKNKRYIDFVSGWCVGNLGWANEEIQQSLRAYKGPAYVPPSFLYKPWAELAELLASIAPGDLKKCFRATGGTEAVELALQAAMFHTKRRKFISIDGAYHGDSVAAIALGSGNMGQKDKRSGSILFRCHKIKPPLDSRALKKLEALLKKKDIAAIIMEPIIINLGVHIPEQDFMEKTASLCRRYGTLFIADEVATGFGRTGAMFATEHYAIAPDIMCIAKGITGGYAPMGATIMTEEVARSMSKNSSYYSTFGWHPLCVEAAIANIKYLKQHKKQLMDNVQNIADIFRERLPEIFSEYEVEIRIKGLAIGVEFESKVASKIVRQAREKGLLLSELDDNVFSMFPALNIPEEVVREGLDILEDCVKKKRFRMAG